MRLLSKTEYVYFKGKAKWAKHTTPDKFGNWKITIYLDDEGYKKVLDLQKEGLKNVLGKDEDGNFVTFRRAQQKMIRGKVVGFAPPEVLNPDGTPLRDVLVGNGSDVTVKVEVYAYKPPVGNPAKAARLMSIRVDNLVPFELSRDFDEDQAKQVGGLLEQPKPNF